MQVTVFGSSGQVGRLVVDNLINSGNSVIAFVHKSNPFQNKEGVTVIQGSITDIQAVAAAVNGSAVVISTLGSWGSPTKDVVSSGTKLIIEAMTSAGVHRFISVTGASAFYSQDEPNASAKLTHIFLGLVAPKILSDGESHLKDLEDSSLDWTAIRSPVMTSSDSLHYRLSEKLPSLLAFVPRQAVAKCLVDQVTATEFIRQAPVIYRG